ncbi:MAG: hypothetical protein LBB12_03030 [Holosporaceae bacterium]|jgi:hypothetical protein|nr:hypothetical protein [Holosporaceae bacterium]
MKRIVLLSAILLAPMLFYNAHAFSFFGWFGSDDKDKKSESKESSEVTESSAAKASLVVEDQAMTEELQKTEDEGKVAKGILEESTSSAEQLSESVKKLELEDAAS